MCVGVINLVFETFQQISRMATDQVIKEATKND